MAGHWHTGTVSGFQHKDGPLAFREKVTVSVEIETTHRDEHDDLPSCTVKLVSEKNDDYKTDENGWKSLDASVYRNPEETRRVTLLGVCGGFHTLGEK